MSCDGSMRSEVLGVVDVVDGCAVDLHSFTYYVKQDAVSTVKLKTLIKILKHHCCHIKA